MRYSGLIENDVVNGEGVCVSLFVQGCHLHCPGCFNPETWSFNSGIDINKNELIDKIITAIGANNIQRNFSILGGDPLSPENAQDVLSIVLAVKEAFPHIKIWTWTGYTLEQLLESKDLSVYYLLTLIDILVDGPYIESERDLSLAHSGSRNQRVIDLKNSIFYDKINNRIKIKDEGIKIYGK